MSEALIDSGKDSATASSLQDLTAEKQTLEQSIPELQSQIGGVQDKETMTPDDLSNRDNLSKQLQEYRTRLAQIAQQIKALTPPASAGISGGFLRDILSDGSGYSFHRFQIFAWTIVLGIIFVSSVYNRLTMPEFSTTLLGLMGISSGTYIGFKFPNKVSCQVITSTPTRAATSTVHSKGARESTARSTRSTGAARRAGAPGRPRCDRRSDTR